MKKGKTILTKIYNKIDKGEPSWLSLFGRIKLTIPVKSIYKQRQKRKYILSFLPDYYNFNYSMIFLHTAALPENSNAVLELKKLKTLMLNYGFVKKEKITSDEDSFKSTYSHKKYGTIDIHIYIDDYCDIEYIDVVKQEPVMVGMCAKVLEELNTN